MRALERTALRAIRALDASCHRLFGWRWNPLHQSGALACLLLVVLVVSGLYLLLLYRVGAPWESVRHMQDQWWLGRWMRSLHRLASDLLILAAMAHALRMFAQARSWGPRTLAWISGVFLVLFAFISGWTGFVMVWDRFGGVLALAGARLLDVVPVLSEPVTRIFAGDRPIPPAFFFINLFLHIAIPLGMGAGLWLHVSRLARPTLLPPRRIAVTILGALIAISVLLPVPLDAAFDPLALPGRVPADAVYAFWLPLANRVTPGIAWVGALITLGVAVAVPRLVRRPRTEAWAPSVVEPAICTGCNQCPQDCPWEAIAMVPRHDARSSLVAHVDPDKCVSCGICAASCAPMGVGPPQRTGRDQLPRIRAFAAESLADATNRVVAIVCESAAPSQLVALRAEGAVPYPVPCTGNLHSSVVELALRAGAPGVIVFSCPPRDCRGREGPKWLEQRLFHDREAELQARVDKARVATATMAVGDAAGTLSALRAFHARFDLAGTRRREPIDDLEVACEPATASTSDHEP